MKYYLRKPDEVMEIENTQLSQEFDQRELQIKGDVVWKN